MPRNAPEDNTMSSFRSFALALLAGVPLLACSQPPPPPAPPAPPSASSAAPKGFIGRQVDKAIDQARQELHKENISISDGFNININGRKFHTADSTQPKAEITPQGDLLIEGKAVAVNPAQRQQLLAYRGQLIGIAETGMAIGAQGANLASEALGGVAGVIFGGKDGGKEFEQRMEAEGRKIEAEAMKLCTRLPALLDSQHALAASLPAFKPYARMTQDDIDDCGKDGKGKGVSVTDAEREQIRSDIRERIRTSVRGAAQAAVADDAPATTSR